MSWIKKKTASLLVVALSCILGVFLFEIGLRIISLDDPWSKTRELNILRNFQITYDISNLYQNDSLVADYKRNEYGLRDVCENPGEIDILTIGGSTTDQRYVPFDSSYQSILEKQLITHVDDFGCVSNAGVDGHSTWGHLFSFEHWFPLIPGLKPKFILLYVGVNDANFQRTNDPISGFDNNMQGGMKGFLKRFEIVNALLPLYRLLRQSSENDSAAYAGHSPRLYFDDEYLIDIINEQTEFLSAQNAKAFRSRMHSLLKSILALDAIPICVTQPHRYVMKKNDKIYGVSNVLGEDFSGIDYDYSIRKLNDVMFELCGENTLDLYNHKFLSSHFYDGVHTTAMGSTEIGERMAEFIIEKFF
ncbi:SGNH/GDSL hydrolase family protein [Alphaproteobacteria bacterium]|nr:SGNH/GDSL hydrolase family protein [Alphaproteobacteria bacterium]